MAEKKRKPGVESAAPAEDRKLALETAMAQIEKNFGKGSIMRLGEAANIDVEAIPTGSLALDLALGVGGVPKGRIIEIYGPESSGKTTLARMQPVRRHEKIRSFGKLRMTGRFNAQVIGKRHDAAPAVPAHHPAGPVGVVELHGEIDLSTP